MKALVTGATGFLGSHIAQRLAERGDSVRALARTTSDTSFLETLGVEIVRGDITDATSLPAALDGVDTVFHAAAKVDDWGPWSDFKAVTINGTRNMLKAASAAATPRFLHVSTDGVYRFRDLSKGVHEDSPLETRFGPLDYYRRAKTAAERIARRFSNEGRLAVTIVRPALILGERDAAMMPGMIAFLKSSSAVIIGNGRNRLPCVYAGDVADICIRAATTDIARGQVYNAVSDEHVTQRDLFQAVADAAGLSMPKRSLPLRLVYAIAIAMETRARLSGWNRRPELTRFAVNLLALDYVEDASKTMRDLGWQPQVTMREAVNRSVEWARERRAQPVGG